MLREELKDVLKKFTPHELDVFTFKYVLCLSDHQTAKIRRYKKPAYIHLSQQVEKKLKKYDFDEETIAFIQVLFSDKCQGSFFDLN